MYKIQIQEEFAERNRMIVDIDEHEYILVIFNEGSIVDAMIYNHK